MSAIEWADIEDAIFNWIVSGSGLTQPGEVFWGEQYGQRPDGTCICLFLTDERGGGLDWIDHVHNPLIYADHAFTGEADDDTLTASVSLVYADKVFTAANATEIFTAAAHGLLTGDGPLRASNAGGALPTGLLAGTDYWVIKIDANSFYLATSVAGALAGTHLSITTDGTGVQTLADTASTRRLAAHGLVTGDGPFRLATTGGLPGGLAVATDYWAIVTGTYTFQLADTFLHAQHGPALALSTDGTGVQTISATNDTVRVGQEILRVARGPRVVTLTVQCLFGDPTGNGRALARLSNVRAMARLVVDDMATAGVSVLSIGTSRSVGAVHASTIFEPRAIMDVELSLASEVSIPAGRIRRVEITDQLGDPTRTYEVS